MHIDPLTFLDYHDLQREPDWMLYPCGSGASHKYSGFPDTRKYAVGSDATPD
jgi:uncharacterized membrane protein